MMVLLDVNECPQCVKQFQYNARQIMMVMKLLHMASQFDVVFCLQDIQREWHCIA